MTYTWIEWDTWDRRTRRYAFLEKKILFEKNKKNGMVSVIQIYQSMLENLQKDIEMWNQKNGIYKDDELWRPEVKILDGVTHRSKILDIIGKNGELISFGHTLFEIVFLTKLAKEY